ncbi:hypothetical protein ACFQ2K_53645, partial [Streptomyces sanglieri]
MTVPLCTGRSPASEGEFGAPGSDQARQADDLTGVDTQRDVGHVVGREVLDVEGQSVRGDPLPYEHGGEVAAHHEADELFLVGGAGVLDAGEAAVAQDRDAVGELEDLLHAVRDVHDRDVLVAQPSDQREQRVDLVLRQGGRG